MVEVKYFENQYVTMSKGWAKGTHHSEEHRRKIGEANRRRIVTEETKRKQSESRKLLFATSPGAHQRLSESMKGRPSPRKGVVLSEETKLKISRNRKGKCLGNKNHIHTQEERDAQRKKLLGKPGRRTGIPQSDSAKQKLREFRTGLTASEETKLKMSKCRTGEKNPNWNGGDKEYCEKWNPEFRRRIRAYWGNTICGACGAIQVKPLLSCHHVYYNKKACCVVSEDGKYFSNLDLLNHTFDFEIVGDPNKFIPLCKHCHDESTIKKNRSACARKFERIINENHGGKSYFTQEEYAAKILGR